MISFMPFTISIATPSDFSFKNTVGSHGWYDLAPFEYDEAAGTLRYVFRLGNSIVPGLIEGRNGTIEVTVPNKKIDSKKIERDVRHLLRLDDEMSVFYDIVSGHETLSWVPVIGAGRLMRSPTVFEDMVKTMCTTNCSWALTKKMVTKLVDALGEPSRDGRRAFPTPDAMAAVDENFYRNEIRAGYRSPYFVELAELVASGELDPESWLTSDLSTPDLKKEIKSVKGFGDYAAENLLKLLGRYEGLALDSWLRAGFYKKHNREKICNDKKILRHYKKFGQWQGLAIWCEMTESWFTTGKNPS
jgi:3-methyladenine DNA glycosylase/8-oxoguanine DNA glycosylase